jgi:hypothetical protein
LRSHAHIWLTAILVNYLRQGTIKPESSPSEAMPEAVFATRAFCRLFSKNVSPSSSSGIIPKELCEMILKLVAAGQTLLICLDC